MKIPSHTRTSAPLLALALTGAVSGGMSGPQAQRFVLRAFAPTKVHASKTKKAARKRKAAAKRRNR